MKLLLMMIALLSGGSLFAQRLKQIITDSHGICATATDGTDYYVAYKFSASSSTDGIFKTDKNGVKTQLIEFDSDTISSSTVWHLMAFDGACLLGFDYSDSIRFYLIRNGNMSYFHTSIISTFNFKKDEVVHGNYLYFHDKKHIYRSQLSSTSDLGIVYTNPEGSSASGIERIHKFGSSLVFYNYFQASAITRIHRLDLNSLTIQEIESGVSINRYVNNEQFFYYLNDKDFPQKVVRIDQNGTKTTVYQQTIGPDGYSIINLLGATYSGLVASMMKNNIYYVALLANNQLTQLNLKTDDNPYPHSAMNSYQAGNYVYFTAQDTSYLQTAGNMALWSTDGTKAGTKRLVKKGENTMPPYVGIGDDGRNEGNCGEDYWASNTGNEVYHHHAWFGTKEVIPNLYYATRFCYAAQSNTLFFTADQQQWQSSSYVYRVDCAQAAELDENDNEPLFRVYPNPAADFVELEFSDWLLSPYEIQLMDLQGKVLHTFNGNKKSASISLTDFSSGIYLLKFSTAGFGQVVRIVKY